MAEKKTINWKQRLRACGLHLAISLFVAAAAAALVFGVWYPYPYREVSGGRELFQLLVTVDVILGPLITLAIFEPAKGWHLLRRDLAVVALLQLSALGYGMWTVFVARPVHLAFEYDRFRVVHAIDVPQDMLAQAGKWRALPLTGPTVLGLRPLKDSKEKGEVTFAALAGLQLGYRPDLWQDYAMSRDEVLKEAKTLAGLKQRLPDQVALIDAAVRDTGRPEAALRYLPMAGRQSFWTVLVDANNAQVMGFIPLDPY